MSVRIDLFEGTRIALTSLTSNRLRTLLTTAGIAVGVATLLAIVGIIQGLDDAFAGQLASMGSNSLYVAKFKMGGGNQPEARNRKDLTMKEVDAIRSQSTYAVGVAPTAMSRTDVTSFGRTINMVNMFGVTEEYIDVSGYQLAGGRFITRNDDEGMKSVVVLGADLVDALFPGIEPVGQEVRLDNRTFRVIGTMARKGKMLDMNFDKSVFVPLKTLGGYYGNRRGFMITVGIEDPKDMDAAQDQIVGILRRVRGTPPEKPDDFVVNRPEQMLELYKKLTQGLYAVITGIGLITLLVGGIGIMNIMLVSVRERTREIGVRRALGARKRTIVMQFLIEAAAVSAVGGVVGTTAGLSLAKIISLITPLAASVRPSTMFFGVTFAALVGLLFGIWPAARAANLDPVEALRYE
ncbi:MAG: ABC transporter permease [Myxococcota bacterium]|nr:ABC transporter permease [Myxococcota bacterium]